MNLATGNLTLALCLLFKVDFLYLILAILSSDSTLLIGNILCIFRLILLNCSNPSSKNIACLVVLNSSLSICDWNLFMSWKRRLSFLTFRRVVISFGSQLTMEFFDMPLLWSLSSITWLKFLDRCFFQFVSRILITKRLHLQQALHTIPISSVCWHILVCVDSSLIGRCCRFLILIPKNVIVLIGFGAARVPTKLWGPNLLAKVWSAWFIEHWDLREDFY